MLEPWQALANLLETAQTTYYPLPTRLRALSLVTQTIDQLFTESERRLVPVTPLDHLINHQDQPRSPLPLPLAVADVTGIFEQINQIFREQIMPLLEQQHISLAPLEHLADEQRSWLQGYFTHRIYPLLTPLAVDPGHPFPYISSDSLNYLMLLQSANRTGVGSGQLYARVKVPRRAVPRIVPIPTEPQTTDDPAARYHLAWSEDIVRCFAAQLFPGMQVRAIYQFHVLRAAQASGPDRHTKPGSEQKWAAVVRLDIEEKIPGWVLHWLLEHLEVPADMVVRCTAPLSMTSLADLADAVTPLLANV